MIRQKYIFILVIVFMLCFIKLSVHSTGFALNKDSSTFNNVKYSEERKYLMDLENLNIEDIEKEIKQTEKLEKLKAITNENGDVDFKKYYKDTIFAGVEYLALVIIQLLNL